MASISCDLGHLVVACSSYKTALDLNPAYLPALKGLGDTLVCQARACLQSNRDGQAVELIAKALPLLVRYVCTSLTHQIYDVIGKPPGLSPPQLCHNSGCVIHSNRQMHETFHAIAICFSLNRIYYSAAILWVLLHYLYFPFCVCGPELLN